MYAHTANRRHGECEKGYIQNININKKTENIQRIQMKFELKSEKQKQFF